MSESSVTLRVKPDRRRLQVSFPETLERRIRLRAARLTEVAALAPASSLVVDRVAGGIIGLGKLAE
jgi:hypothetical protein